MKKLLHLAICLLLSSSVFAQHRPSFAVEVVGELSTHAILIPGFSCSAEVWETTLPQLQPGYTCHLLTLAGFAGQPKMDNPSLALWVRDIAQYVQEKRLGKVTLIGHSMGGMIALQLAARHADLIEQIVVVDALPCLAALQNADFQSNDQADCSQTIAMFTGQNATQFAQMQNANVTNMCTAVKEQEKIVNWAIASDRATLGEVFCQLMQTDLRDELANIKCPSLILLEANFKFLKTSIAKQYELLKNVNMRYADKGMHFIMYDDPDWYATQLQDFLFTNTTVK